MIAHLLAILVSSGWTLPPAPAPVDMSGPVTLTESSAVTAARCDAYNAAPKKPKPANPAELTCAAYSNMGRYDAALRKKGLTQLIAAADAGYATARLALAEEYRHAAPPDDARAAALDKAAADSGSVEGQLAYAHDLTLGDGVAQDYAQAVVILRRAAEAGDGEAQRTLAGDLMTGEGTAVDVAEGMTWLKAAADHGDVDAQGQYGEFLYYGTGTTADPAAAIPYLQAAAENDDAYARFVLADAYLDGRGVAKNETTASRLYARATDGQATAVLTCAHCSYDWLRRAAANGRVGAALSLARTYADPQAHGDKAHDLEKAAMWFDVAAKSPVPLAPDGADIIAHLSPDAAAKAQGEADAFVAQSARDLTARLDAYHADIGKPVSDFPPGYTICQEIGRLGAALPADCTAWYTLPPAATPVLSARIAATQAAGPNSYVLGFQLVTDIADGKAGIPTADDIARLTALPDDGGWPYAALGAIGPWARPAMPELEARLAARHADIGTHITSVAEGEYPCQALTGIGVSPLPTDCAYWFYGAQAKP